MVERDLNEGPGDHDAHLMDDDTEETVACPRCGEHVWAYAQRCDYCGVHYSGEAWQFDSDGGTTDSNPWFWPVVVAMLVLAILIIALF